MKDRYVEMNVRETMTALSEAKDTIYSLVYASDSSYVMDRKAQINWLTNYCQAWDKLMSNNALSETLINALSGELHLFYDANGIAYDCAEAALSRLEQERGTRIFKEQVVKFGGTELRFMPNSEDFSATDGIFSYHYLESMGKVFVKILPTVFKEPQAPIIVHEQPIQW